MFARSLSPCADPAALPPSSSEFDIVGVSEDAFKASLQSALGGSSSAEGAGRRLAHAQSRRILELTGGALDRDGVSSAPASAFGGALPLRSSGARALLAAPGDEGSTVPAWLPRDTVERALGCDRALHAAAEAIASGADDTGAAGALGAPVAIPRGAALDVLDGTEDGWAEAWRERRVDEARGRGAADPPVWQLLVLPRVSVCCGERCD